MMTVPYQPRSLECFRGLLRPAPGPDYSWDPVHTPGQSASFSVCCSTARHTCASLCAHARYGSSSPGLLLLGEGESPAVGDLSLSGERGDLDTPGDLDTSGDLEPAQGKVV